MSYYNNYKKSRTKKSKVNSVWDKKLNKNKHRLGGSIRTGSSSTSFIPNNPSELYTYLVVQGEQSKHEKYMGDLEVQKEFEKGFAKSSFADAERDVGIAQAGARVQTSAFKAVSDVVSSAFDAAARVKESKDRKHSSMVNSFVVDKNGYYQAFANVNNAKFNYKNNQKQRKHNKKLAKYAYKNSSKQRKYERKMYKLSSRSRKFK